MIDRTTLAVALCSVIAAGCAMNLNKAPVGHARPVAEWSGDFNNVYRDGEVYFAGRPTSNGIYAAAGKGVLIVVDLQTREEHQDGGSLNELALVNRLGMQYVNIPITPETFSEADVDRFAAILGSTEGPVLVHCSSSNRAGGLWAAYLASDRGFTIDDAIACGREAGLNRESMIEAVRRVVPPAPVAPDTASK